MSLALDFIAMFGPPVANTRSEAVVARMQAFVSGVRLVALVGAGIFDDGFFSLGSVREEAAGLGGWDQWLPRGSFCFASSVFGVFYIAAPDGQMWLLHSQIGSLMPTEFDLDEAVLQISRPTTREGLLNRALFKAWMKQHGHLVLGHLLISDPPVIEAGVWDASALRSLPAADFMAATSALFEPVGPIPVSIVDPRG